MHFPGGINVQKRLGFRWTSRVPAKAGIWRRAILLAAALMTMVPMPVAALPTLAVRPPPAAEQPALWVLRDADTTIYLFGTFHALDERTDWFASNIRAAFDSADQLVLETLVPATPAELFKSLSRHAIVAQPIVGQPVTGGQPGSFAASASQTMAVSRSAGLTVERGADAVLRGIANREGKPVDGLESFDSQLAMFAGLQAAAAPAVSTIQATPADSRQAMLAMSSAWRRGDASSFASVLVNLEAQSPATYKRLFVDRNNQWARWIAERMRRPGTVFVAVGTGHLIGHDSVQQQLASRGLTTTRIN